MTRPHGKTEFALRLSRFREARQLSQKQLAARIGCQPNLISKYESGQRMPRTPEMWIRLSAALTVSPAELLGLPLWNAPFEDPRLAVRLRELRPARGGPRPRSPRLPRCQEDVGPSGQL